MPIEKESRQSRKVTITSRSSFNIRGGSSNRGWKRKSTPQRYLSVLNLILVRQPSLLPESVTRHADHLQDLLFLHSYTTIQPLTPASLLRSCRENCLHIFRSQDFVFSSDCTNHPTTELRQADRATLVPSELSLFLFLN